ncbi:hypothetical protein ElyMa_005987500 [Elysia marginata]|uniref:Uncharacterized protein n=1 Tax=Elysia marginata TaxID=1093978 RepID=A0AAV4GFC7_9GAST|nr:hypothetical protein ElyMa_005987500 [Elysia marginata]
MTGESTASAAAMYVVPDGSSRYANPSTDRLSPPSPPDYRDVMAARNGYGMVLMVADEGGGNSNRSNSSSGGGGNNNIRECNGTIYSIGSTAGGRDYLSPPASPNLSLRSRERDRDRAVFGSPVTSSSTMSSNSPRSLNLTGCRNPSSPPPLQPPLPLLPPPPTSVVSMSPPSPSPPISAVVAAVGPASPPHSHHHHHHHHYHHHHHQQHQQQHLHPHHRRLEPVPVPTSSATALRDRDFIGAHRNATQQFAGSSSSSSNTSNANGSMICNSSNNNTTSAAGREREYLSMRNSILGSPRFHRRNMPGRARGLREIPSYLACSAYHSRQSAVLRDSVI